MTERPSLARSILNWLRAGYPQGLPREDYLPLLEVLHRRLTEAEVGAVVEQLTSDEPDTIDRSEIESAIAKLALEKPGDEDVARVAERLEAGGWPTSGVEDLVAEAATPDDETQNAAAHVHPTDDRAAE